MIGIALALLSAMLSGLSIVLVRKHSDTSNTFNISLVITIIGIVILWPAALLSNELEAITIFWAIIFFAVSGVLSPGLVRLLYYKGMGRLGAPVNSAIYSTNPFYSSLLAVVLLNELLTVWNIAGIAAIIIGITLMELNPTRSIGQTKRYRMSFIFPAVAALTLGISSIIRKYALDLSNAPVFGVAIAYTFSMLPYLLVLTFYSPTRKKLQLKQNFRWFWMAGVGQAITWILAFYALNFEQVTIVMPLIATEPLFVAAFAIFYLKELENISFKLIASIIITVIGVIGVIL